MVEGTEIISDIEVLTVMSLPKSAGLIPKYKKIWHQATGNKWTGCLCGSGFTRLYELCSNYANGIKNKQ